MLKSKITSKSEFDALHDEVKKLYKEEGGNYLLQSDGADELRRAKDEEAERRRRAEEERDNLARDKEKADREAATAREEKDREAARKAGDLKALEDTLNTQWKAKLDAETARANGLETKLKTALIDGKAEAIAEAISTTPELLIPMIAARLDADISLDKPTTRVKDAAGNVSSLTLEQLRQEFVDNKKFAPIIKGTNASGAGGNGGGSGGGAASKKISEMTEAERVQFHQRDAAGYKQQAAAEGMPVYG